MMKNLSKMREATSNSNDHTRISNTSRTSLSMRTLSPSSSSNLSKRRNLQDKSKRNGGDSLSTSQNFDNSSRFDARIASPSNATIPLTKRNESSSSNMTTTSSNSTLSSASENTYSGSRMPAKETRHQGSNKRSSVAASIRVPASIDEN